MNSNNFESAIKKIVGLKLDSVRLACEMFMFNFDKYAIHSQCLTRVIKGNDILVTTLDYQSWDGEIDTNNDEWFNLDKYLSQIEGGKVVSLQVLPWYDLIINLDNNIVIQILIENSYAHYNDESEQYRFFKVCDESEDDDSLDKHYVVYSKRIDIDG